jgi:hypothetical protein
MKKSLIAIVAMVAAISAQASQTGGAQDKKAEILFQAGGVDRVSTVIEGKVVQAEFFDGIRIVRLADGNCQVETHRYTPNAANPIAGTTNITTAVFGYNCVLNQPPVSPVAAFK